MSLERSLSRRSFPSLTASPAVGGRVGGERCRGWSQISAADLNPHAWRRGRAGAGSAGFSQQEPAWGSLESEAGF